MHNTIVILIILVFFSGCFSATETAFSSLNKIRLKYLANNGDVKAQKTLALTDNFNSLLSTILIGNNIVNIASSSIATVLFVSIFLFFIVYFSIYMCFDFCALYVFYRCL